MTLSLVFSYMRERRTWIAFIIAVVLFINVLMFLDQGFAFVTSDSMLYFNLVVGVSFVVFFIWRLYRETVLIRKLLEIEHVDNIDWLDFFGSLDHHSEQVIRDVILDIDRVYRTYVTEIRSTHVLESDHIDAWVHELKAPLTAMRLTMDRHRHNPAIQSLESDWLRLHLLLDEQLYLSRLGTISSDYVLEKVTLYPLITQEIRLIASGCFEKNIAIEVEGDEELVALTDSRWWMFVFRQLLTNAVKYSPEGSTITVTLTTIEQFPAVQLKDEGRGIPREDIPRLFERGFTGTKGRRSNAATGLGLYLVDMISRRIGLRLALQTEVGEGTEWTITFTKSNAYDEVFERNDSSVETSL